MTDTTRGDLVKSSAAFWLASRCATPIASAAPGIPAAAWARHNRTLIAEGYNSPFHPVFEDAAERAIAIATALNCDPLRSPTVSYCAFFPTESGHPMHPRRKGNPIRFSLKSKGASYFV